MAIQLTRIFYEEEIKKFGMTTVLKVGERMEIKF
jgi:hypothetical protein